GLLAEVFLREASRRLGRTFDPISQGVLEALKSYEWPGNVRELQNVIERAAVISTGKQLQLPEQWTLPSGSFSSAEAADANGSVKSVPSESTLEELERSHILQVLQQTGWRVEGSQGAATILGLNPSTLRSRMRKLGIRRIESIRRLAMDPVSRRDI